MARLIDADEILRELKNCRNELCIKCGEYTGEYLGHCDGCRYNRQNMAKWENMPTVDAVPVRQMTLAAFDALDRLSTAHYGKQMFFMQDNGMIYDRYECDYITLDTAINRMAKILMLDEDRIC